MTATKRGQNHSILAEYKSFEDASSRASDLIAAHIARSKELHAQGTLRMSGAFLNHPQEPSSTMAILISPEAAEEYIKGDPFYLNGMVRSWSICAWANMFAQSCQSDSTAVPALHTAASAPGPRSSLSEVYPLAPDRWHDSLLAVLDTLSPSSSGKQVGMPMLQAKHVTARTL
jgi:uncharacterized protein YciI